MKNEIFKRADILLPQGIDNSKFSVVACDQYTSEPDYWNAVKDYVGDSASALKMIFPEIYLKTADFEKTIENINESMKDYLQKDLFKEYKNSFIYLERTLKNGSVRKGVMGMVDLEEYNYEKGSQSAIRATEGTVLERIPPRVKIRENAPLELPHVMLLIDDGEKNIIEPLSEKKNELQKVYSFDMMMNSGKIEGYLLNAEESERLENMLAKLSDQDLFNAKYGVSDKAVLPFAVGDGNHSLATARKCYLNLKEKIGDKALSHPARYALVELVNLHDSSLEFEAIHRVVFGVDPQKMIDAFKEKYVISNSPASGAQKVTVVLRGECEDMYITNPHLNLAVGSLQEFIDEYLAKNGGEVDYIHGDDVVKSLSMKDQSVGFILESMEKDDLFKTVILDGALPRKTFSMGEACDKRFYLEARKISE